MKCAHGAKQENNSKRHSACDQWGSRQVHLIAFADRLLLCLGMRLELVKPEYEGTGPCWPFCSHWGPAV